MKTSLGGICHDAMQTAFISCCNTERVNYENPNKHTLKPFKTHFGFHSYKLTAKKAVK
jgi:hypothetical protein